MRKTSKIKDNGKIDQATSENISKGTSPELDSLVHQVMQLKAVTAAVVDANSEADVLRFRQALEKIARHSKDTYAVDLALAALRIDLSEVKQA